MENWDDLRLITSVARLGSFSAAAKVLGLDHSTVLRRIRSFEKAQGVVVFQKSNRGLVLTEAGERLLPQLDVIEEQILALSRGIKGQNQSISGNLVITTTDAIGCTSLPVCIERLQTLCPDLNISIHIANAFANLDRAEADIAIRPSSSPPSSYIGRKLGAISFSFYATSAYAKKTKLKDASQVFDLAKVITYDFSLADLPAARWLEPQLKPNHFIRTNSVLMAARMAANGLGCAMLPHFIARFIPELQPIPESPEVGGGDLWILAHKDLMRMRRVSFAFKTLAELIPSTFFH